MTGVEGTPTAWDGILDPGERIVWQGHPTGRLRLEFEGPFQVVFMAIWGGIPLVMIISQPAALFLIVPVFFVGIALWFFIGQHFWAAYQRRNTFYTVTNSRAFIARKGFVRRQLSSYPITADTEFDLEDRPGGAVWFGAQPKTRMFSNTHHAKIGFEQLADPRAAYQALRGVQRGTA